MSDEPETIEAEVVTEPMPITPVQQLPAMADTSPPALLAAAVQSNLDIDKLERLVALNERWQAEQARTAFFEAFAAFQARVPVLTKDKLVSFGQTQYRHASLGSIMREIAPPLEASGLSFRFQIDNDESGGLSVACIVSHAAGHSEHTAMSAPADSSGSKNAIQSRGSTVTYLQRYTLVAALGLVTADPDDDGLASSAGQPPERARQKAGDRDAAAPASQPQKKPSKFAWLHAGLKEERIDYDRFKAWLESAGSLKRVDGELSMNTATPQLLEWLRENKELAVSQFRKWDKTHPRENAPEGGEKAPFDGPDPLTDLRAAVASEWHMGDVSTQLADELTESYPGISDIGTMPEADLTAVAKKLGVGQ